jgi:hypothetical protein
VDYVREQDAAADEHSGDCLPESGQPMAISCCSIRLRKRGIL